MITDYARRITCHQFLFRIYARMENSLLIVLNHMRDDLYPRPLSLCEYADNVRNDVIKPAIYIRQIKVETTSPDHPEIEDSEVVQIAHPIFDAIEVKLQNKMVRPLQDNEAWDSSDCSACLIKAVEDGLLILAEIKKYRSRVDEKLDALMMKYAQVANPDVETAKKVVVSADLCKYGLIASTRDLDELFRLNQSIQKAVHQAILNAGAGLDKTIVIPTGDGAIVLFDEVTHALRFATELAGASDRINAEITDEEHRRYFRIGISMGDIKYQPYSHMGSPALGAHLAGVPIARAVRLQTAAPQDAIYVQNHVADEALQKGLSLQFEDPIDVRGKEHERDMRPIKARPLRRGRPPGVFLTHGRRKTSPHSASPTYLTLSQSNDQHRFCARRDIDIERLGLHQWNGHRRRGRPGLRPLPGFQWHAHRPVQSTGIVSVHPLDRIHHKLCRPGQHREDPSAGGAFQ